MKEMKVVVQRVKQASVSINQQVVGKIDHGFCLLVGFVEGDSLADLNWCAQKISKLRIFDDAEGKMNLDIFQVGGSILSISQFTLAGDVKKSNRPSFTSSMNIQQAQQFYAIFNQQLEALGCRVATGQFQAEMQVSLINDGPVTIIVESQGRR